MSTTSISTAKILITLGDMSSCQESDYQDFFSTYLQFLLGEMVNVLLLGVRSVRVVDHVETVFKIFSVFTYSSCLARRLMYCSWVF